MMFKSSPVPRSAGLPLGAHAFDEDVLSRACCEGQRFAMSRLFNWFGLASTPNDLQSHCCSTVWLCAPFLSAYPPPIDKLAVAHLDSGPCCSAHLLDLQFAYAHAYVALTLSTLLLTCIAEQQERRSACRRCEDLCSIVHVAPICMFLLDYCFQACADPR